MFKNILPLALAAIVTIVPACAEDAVFTNSDTQQMNLQPLTYTSVPVVKSSEASAQTKAVVPSSENQVSNQNFLNAINNLDNAQVEIREQMAAISALMAQSKTAYEAKKEEYNAYKKQYNQLKNKMKSVEKSKTLIQENVNVTNTTNN